jgi:MtN3 and saliva related transmembrane protein
MIMMDFITNNLSDIIGYTASICLVLGYMPQAIYTIRTHDTEGIALPTFLMMGLGGIFFAIQGLLLENWPLFITNVITTVSSAIVFGIKMYNDYFKKDKKK